MLYASAENRDWGAGCIGWCLVLVTAASGGSSLFDQYRPFAIFKPINRKT
jgi:hypothetical protein